MTTILREDGSTTLLAEKRGGGVVLGVDGVEYAVAPEGGFFVPLTEAPPAPAPEPVADEGRVVLTPEEIAQIGNEADAAPEAAPKKGKRSAKA